jgi:hypothetical protein
MKRAWTFTVGPGPWPSRRATYRTIDVMVRLTKYPSDRLTTVVDLLEVFDP